MYFNANFQFRAILSFETLKVFVKIAVYCLIRKCHVSYIQDVRLFVCSYVPMFVVEPPMFHRTRQMSSSSAPKELRNLNKIVNPQ